MNFKTKRMAVLVFDGEHWHAGIYLGKGLQWSVLDTITVKSRSLKQIPAAVMDFISEKQAQTVRMLIPADLHTLPMEMPDDVDNEELHTALAYEVAEEMGKEAHLLRLATVEAAIYGMGCEPGVYMMAGFDTRQVEAYVQQLKSSGIRFEGVGALELGLLAIHAQHPEERLLLLRHRSGFYAVPGMEAQPFYMTSVQTGLQPEQNEREQQRLVRLHRRLETHDDIPLRVVTATGDGEPDRDRVHQVVPKMTHVSVVALDGLMQDLMQGVLLSRVDESQSACPLVGPPSPPKDPHRSGTWIFLFLVLLTAVYIATRWYYSRVDLRGEQKRMVAWKILTDERRKAASACENLHGERNRQLNIYRTLTATNRLPNGLLAMVDVLAVSMPQYTRISSIRQTAADSFLMEGQTRWASGKIQLDRVLSVALSQCGLVVEPGPLEYREDAREQHFVYHIAPHGGSL